MAVDLSDDGQTLHSKLRQILYIFPRHYLHQETALEIQLRDGSSYFLDLTSIRYNDLPPLFGTCDFVKFKKSELSDQWLARELSNFGYLMCLNVMAGRSFDDVTQWPVMPNLADLEDLGKPTPLETNWDADLERHFSESVIPSSLVDRLFMRFEPFTTNHLRARRPDPICSLDGLRQFEWPAELYFQPELFSNVNSLDLPAFSIPESGFAMIYKHQKLLEAPTSILDSG
jgi:hypothetical protein